MSQLIFGNRIGKNLPLLVGSSAQIYDSTGEKILLTKRGDKGSWCLPGGQLDSGESVHAHNPRFANRLKHFATATESAR